MPEFNLPAFAKRMASLDDEAKSTVLSAVHPDYSANSGNWQVLVDAFEGRGGFADGSYLWPYPRETEDDFGKRKAMARYHNYLESLVDIYVRFVFTQGVKRTSKSDEYNKWLDNVDGAGTDANELLKRFASIALSTGHAGLLVDKTNEMPTGATKADEVARVIATIFPATTIADWRFSTDGLSAIKLIEQALPKEIDAVIDPSADSRQILMWDRKGWARFAADGTVVGGDIPNIGLVPFVVLRPKPSQTSPMLARAIVSNANVIRALFNRASEEDEVIRQQAFSMLIVSVPQDGSVEDAKASLGNVVGSAKAIVVKGQADYKTPDQSVPSTIRDNIAYLVQEVYRAAHVRFRRDSLAAESGDAIRLQYAELNEMLQGLSRSLSQAEKEIARAWFAWNSPTPEAGKAEFEKAEPQAIYPDEFFIDALIDDLEAWAEAIRMNLGPTMTKHIKKRAARRVNPDMTPDEMKQVDAEIDAQSDEELSGMPVAPPTALDQGGEDGTGRMNAEPGA